MQLLIRAGIKVKSCWVEVTAYIEYFTGSHLMNCLHAQQQLLMNVVLKATNTWHWLSLSLTLLPVLVKVWMNGSCLHDKSIVFISTPQYGRFTVLQCQYTSIYHSVSSIWLQYKNQLWHQGITSTSLSLNTFAFYHEQMKNQFELGHGFHATAYDNQVHVQTEHKNLREANSKCLTQSYFIWFHTETCKI